MISATAKPNRLFSVVRLRGAKPLSRASGLIVPIALIIIWQLIKSTGLVSYADLPAPSAVWSATADLVSSSALQDNIAHTLEAAMGGWLMGSAVGLILGIALGLSERAWTWSMASVEVLRSLPAITFVPIAVIILGQTTRMEMVIAAWVSIWPVVVSTIDGVRGVSPIHLDLARSLRLTRKQQIMKFNLPTAAPNICVALRLGLAAALALAIVAEIVGTPHGVGYALVQAQLSLHPAQMFSYILVIGFVGLIVNYLLTFLLGLIPGAVTVGEQSS